MLPTYTFTNLIQSTYKIGKQSNNDISSYCVNKVSAEAVTKEGSTKPLYPLVHVHGGYNYIATFLTSQ